LFGSLIAEISIVKIDLEAPILYYFIKIIFFFWPFFLVDDERIRQYAISPDDDDILSVIPFTVNNDCKWYLIRGEERAGRLGFVVYSYWCCVSRTLSLPLPRFKKHRQKKHTRRKHP